MTKNQKIVAWVSIVGAGLAASFGSAVTFFSDHTALITGIGGIVSAIVALLVTIFNKTTTTT